MYRLRKAQCLLVSAVGTIPWFVAVVHGKIPAHNEEVSVFGLPAATVVIIFGIPAIWVIYTLVFVYLSRSWRAEDVAEDQLIATANHERYSGTDNGGPA